MTRSTRHWRMGTGQPAINKDGLRNPPKVFLKELL